MWPLVSKKFASWWRPERPSIAGRVEVVAERAVPDAAQVARVEDREHGDERRRARGRLEQRAAPRRSRSSASSTSSVGAAVTALSFTSTAAANTAPAAYDRRDDREPERDQHEHHRHAVRVDPPAELGQRRRDRDQRRREQPAEPARQPPPEQVGEHDPDRGDGHDPEPHARHGDAVHPPDRLQDEVEARHLRREHLAPERGAVAQLVQAHAGRRPRRRTSACAAAASAGRRAPRRSARARRARGRPPSRTRPETGRGTHDGRHSS